MSVAVAAPALKPLSRSPRFRPGDQRLDLETATSASPRTVCRITPTRRRSEGAKRSARFSLSWSPGGTRIEVNASSVLVNGEFALGSERWAIRSAGAEGTVFEQSSRPVIVARLVEGTWKLAIAAPWG